MTMLKKKFIPSRVFLLLLSLISATLSAQQIRPSVQQGHFGDITNIAVSPSAKTLATFGTDKQLVFWDLKTGMQLKRMSWQSPLSAISFFNDSILTIQISKQDLKYLNVLNTSFITEQLFSQNTLSNESRTYSIKGPLLQVFENDQLIKSHTTQYFDKGYTSYAVNKNNNYLFVSALDGWIYVYDVKSLKIVRTLREHRAAVQDLVLSSDGSLLYSTGNDRSIIEWDAKTLELKRRLHAHSFRITAVSFYPSANKLYFGNELGEIKSINLSSLTQQLNVTTVSNHPVIFITPEIHKRDTGLLTGTLKNTMYEVDKNLSGVKTTNRFHTIAPKQFLRRVMEGVFHAYTEPSVKKFNYSKKGTLEVYNADEKGNRLRRIIIAKNTKTGKKVRVRSSLGRVSHLTVVNDTLFAVARTPAFYYIGTEPEEIELWKMKGRKLYLAKLPAVQIKGMASFGQDNLVTLTAAGSIDIYNITENKHTYKQIPVAGAGEAIWIKDSFFFVASSTNELVVFRIDKENNLQHYHTFTGHEGKILSVDIHPEKKIITTASEDATIKFWSLEKNELLATLIPVDNNDFIFLLPNGNYQITKKAYRMFGFNKGLDFYYPDQFDLRYNRPHEILSALNSGTPEQISALKKAYEKRLKRMGFSEDKLSDELILPEIKIAAHETKENNTCVLKLEVSDPASSLDRINVMVNNVLIFGSKGYSLKDKNLQAWKGELAIPLLEGSNKIEVSVLNDKGVESFRPSLIVTGSKPGKPVLHLICIGVSDYRNNDFDLAYPAKDAKDMAKVFSLNSKKVYADVRTLVITDSAATTNNIEKNCRDFLSGTAPNDVVLLFFAGHGVLDKELNYYLATHDMDFADPAGKGMSYEKLEALIDGIAPLRKTLFMDACHSGEVDKDEIEQLAVENSVNTGNIKFRKAGAGIQKKNLGLQSTSELMGELFTDVRRGTGATVVSSAGGAEYAMESDQWKNGLFTYCLLHGIKDKAADINHDGMIMLSELQQYLQKKVLKLSKGQQKPTSRIENLCLDFRVW